MIAREMFVVDATRTPRIQKLVEERINAEKCLCCEKVPHRLGLCDHHYYQHREIKKAMGPRRAKKYEAKAIQEGKLLDRDEIWELKRKKDSVLAEIASEVVE